MYQNKNNMYSSILNLISSIISFPNKSFFFPKPLQTSLKISCGKSLKNMEEAELHATRTGHSNFTESSESVKPLTDEEKQAQLLRLELSCL